jgi:hypothetical protein
MGVGGKAESKDDGPDGEPGWGKQISVDSPKANSSSLYVLAGLSKTARSVIDT